MDRALIAVALLALIAGAVLAYRRRAATGPEHFEPGDAGLSGRGVGVVGFSGPYCLACQRWESALGAAGVDFRKVDVSERPELARKYGVRHTPLVLAVSLPDGRVLERYDDEPRPEQVEQLAALTRA